MLLGLAGLSKSVNSATHQGKNAKLKLLCPKVEAERYREGAEAFVDRVFFQEEIDECLSFLASSIKAVGV